MLLLSLKQIVWKKSAVYVCYLHNYMTLLLIPKVQIKLRFYFLNFLNKFYLLIFLFFYFVNIPHFSLEIEFFKLKSFLGDMLFIKSCNRIFMTQYLFLSFFLIIWVRSVPDTYYANNYHTIIMLHSLWRLRR